MTLNTPIFSLSGKTALVTGATGHLGTAMAAILAEAGAHVLVNSRSEIRCDELTRRLLDAGYSAEPALFDVTRKDEIDTYFANRKDRKLHVLINNACAGAGGTIESSEPQDYADSYDVTLIAAHNVLKAALPHLRKARQSQEDASVVNISTMYGVVSPDLRIYDSPKGSNPPFYGAAKAALLQWTRYAACEFGPEGIRVNSITPGPFPSPTVQLDKAFIQRLTNKVPLRRIGVPGEIKGPVLFLASPASSFVNGTNLAVDGGWTSW